MLSCMETPLGLMIIGPQGQSLRLQRGHPAFFAGKDLLDADLPAQQVWNLLQTLVANPIKGLVTWCERFGLVLKEEGDLFRLQDTALSKNSWQPLIKRSQRAGSSPVLLLNLAEKLGGHASVAAVADVCIHVHNTPMGGQEIGLARKVLLPKEARTGDIVTSMSRGDTPFIVSYKNPIAALDGTLIFDVGMVLGPLLNEDVLAQPAIIGFNQTYQCQEGTEDGWMADLSFDSLAEARLNAKEIQASGSEVRILNRITNEPVSLLP